MAIKKNSTPFYLNPKYLIIYSVIITVLFLLCFLFPKPKPVAITHSEKSQVAKIGVGKGTVSVAKNGEIKLIGDGIKLDLDTSQFLTITKYREPEWIISANYAFPSSECDLTVGKRIIGGIFVTGGIRAVVPNLSGFRAIVGVSFVF